MNILSIFIGFLIANVNGQFCSVCGDNKEITNPDAIFSFPEQPSISCEGLQTAGEFGLVPINYCDFLPMLIVNVCGCAVKTPESPPEPQSCSVCGDNLEISNPDAVFSFPGQPSVSCANLQLAGKQGLIPVDECVLLPGIISDLCGCGPQDFIPIPTGVPTLEPTSQPTSQPTSPPTPQPTIQPTIQQPILDPTQNPTDRPIPVFTPESTPPTTNPAGTRVCPDIPANGCSICGPDQCVHDFGAKFGAISCGYWEEAGLGGAIEKGICDMFPANGVAAVCDCRETIPAPQPTPVPQPGTRVCPSIPSNGCSICGPDQCVHDPDAMFGEYACGYWEEAGLGGAIEKDICDMFPANGVAAVCDCRETIPVPQPTPPQPTSPGTRICPSIPSNGCSVCGPNRCVNNPAARFGFQDQDFEFTCAQWEMFGLNGQIENNICVQLPSYLESACACLESAPDNGQPMLQPSLRPVQSPIINRPTTQTFTAQPQVRTRAPTRPPSFPRPRPSSSNQRPGQWDSKKERRQRK